MATAHRTILQGLLSFAAALCVATPAAAAINAVGNFPAVADANLELPTAPATPAQPIGWHEQPMLEQPMPGQATGIAAPTALIAGHASHIAHQREDRDLSPNNPAIQRYNLTDEEPLVNAHWWQALPGIGVALFLGLALYMRRPIQRKRKYRSTPHEPSGAYSRRGNRR